MLHRWLLEYLKSFNRFTNQVKTIQERPINSMIQNLTAISILSRDCYYLWQNRVYVGHWKIYIYVHGIKFTRVEQSSEWTAYSVDVMCSRTFNEPLISSLQMVCIRVGMNVTYKLLGRPAHLRIIIIRSRREDFAIEFRYTGVRHSWHAWDIRRRQTLSLKNKLSAKCILNRLKCLLKSSPLCSGVLYYYNIINHYDDISNLNISSESSYYLIHHDWFVPTKSTKINT